MPRKRTDQKTANNIPAESIKTEIKHRAREARIELSRRHFWWFCKTLSPEFYTESRKYLKVICDILQAFFEGVLKLPGGGITKKLIMQIPPRHGKTRTLTNFSAWVLGKNSKWKTITGSYNDDTAVDFSKWTRDIISRERVHPDEIVYSDIFPMTILKHGSKSMKKWAVVGSHFSYKGAGCGGSITGYGGNMLMIDDPIKDAETAFNENALDKLWLWYTGTWLSRKEHNALQIINHTAWSKRDIPGRLLSSNRKKEWYVLTMQACIDEEKKEMLCPEILSYDEYKELEDTMDPYIFAANYKSERLDILGMMYDKLKTYTDLPVDQDGKELCQTKIMVADTAGQGEDHFVAIYANVYKGMAYVFDVDFTQEDIDVTEKSTAFKLIDNKIPLARIENNAAGHSFAFHVEEILAREYKWFGTQIQEFPSTKNKQARIFANRIEVMNRIIFPADWRHRWPDFYNAVTTYSKVGKNKHDDGPDALTMLADWLKRGGISGAKINHRIV